MNSSPDHFDDLRRLLALKRHEQPPPGYFHHFSDKVLARIRAAEASDARPWWDRLLTHFYARPALACAFGLAISSLLLAGFTLSRGFESEMASAPQLQGPWFAATPEPSRALPVQISPTRYASRGDLVSFSSVSPVLPSDPQVGHFGPSGIKVQTASFKLGGY